MYGVCTLLASVSVDVEVFQLGVGKERTLTDESNGLRGPIYCLAAFAIIFYGTW